MLEILGFQPKEVHGNKQNGIVQASGSDGRQFCLTFDDGRIYYDVPQIYSVDHLATNLPDTNKIVEITTNFLPKIGIQMSEIRKYPNGKPIISYDPNPQGRIYFLHNFTTVTNLDHRLIAFRRALDGIVYYGSGGNGTIDYGDNGRILDIMIYWRGVKRVKQVPTLNKEEILKCLKNGRCYFPRWVYLPYDDNRIDIDWAQVKHLTINKVEPRYLGNEYPEGQMPIHWFILPFAVLQARVDMPTTNLNIEIDCPLIEH